MDVHAQLELFRWLADGGGSTRSGEEILEGFCERLDQGGVPLTRVALTFESLDPMIEAQLLLWTRDEGSARREAFARLPADAEAPESWLSSPFFVLYNGNDISLRRRLDVDGAEVEFPIFEELKALGGTDYLALKRPFRRPGAGEGILSSWTTDQPGGFTDTQLEILESVLPGLDLAIEAVALSHSSQSLLATYLGRDAASRILDGAIERGVAHALDAVIWASDLAGFTKLTDTQPQSHVIDLLNGYAERTVAAIEAGGGDVLKFTGDGILAVFDRDGMRDAPERAIEAALRALRETEALSLERQEVDLPASRLRVALHCGSLFYGNVGSPSRLDFTVIGPAVNEATRLCEICKSVDRDLVVSASFHDAAPALRPQLVRLGRFALRGVSRSQQLYTVDEGG